VALALLLAGIGWCAPARGQTADRQWWNTLLFKQRGDAQPVQADSGLGESVIAWTAGDVDPVQDGPLHAVIRHRGGGLGPDHVLDAAPVASFRVTGSIHGGAIVVWFAWGGTRELRAATVAPGGHEFSPTLTLASPGYNPELAANERGDALVGYYGEDGHSLSVRRRPAGGAFGAPVALSSDASGLSVAVAPDGTALVGYQERDRLIVQIAPPGRAFGPRHMLGTPQAEQVPGVWYGARVLVGMDAAGNAVAAWPDGSAASFGGAVKLAFKGPADAHFSVPYDTGLGATGSWGIPSQTGLVVTGPGEVLLAAMTKPVGREVPETTGAVFADARRRLVGAPATLTDDYSLVSIGANERGDAVLAYTEPPWGGDRLLLRRRAPGGSFGPAVQPRASAQPPWAWPVERAQVDAYGNAQLLWTDRGPTGDPPERTPDTLVAEDEPFITQPPPPVGPFDGPVPPVLASESEPPPAARADTTAPRLRLRIERRVRGRYAFARVRCSERCSLRVRHGIASVAKRATGAKLSPGRERRLRLRLTKRTVRSLRHSRRGRKLRVVLQARDAAGNSRRIRRTARVRVASRSRRASGDPR
jgi:hypothetical protein